MHNSRSAWPILALITATLAACSQHAAPRLPSDGAAPSLPGPTFTAASTTAAPYALALSIDGTDTVQGLEQEYPGSKVAVFAPKEGYALLAASSGELPAEQGSVGAAAVGRPVKKRAWREVEPNKDRISGGGTLTASIGGRRMIWAGGEMRTWTGGRRMIWAGGAYSPVPENNTPFKRIRLEEAHTLAPNLGAGVKVAVIDTGIDLTHAAFEGALAPAAEWKDFYGNDADPQEEGVLGVDPGTGHGTAVASIVLQVAPAATILPLRVLGPDGSGDVLQVAQAIDYAVSQGAQIINLSLGSTEQSKVVQDAVNRAASKNVLVVSSAGNANVGNLTYPAQNMADGESGKRSLSVGSVSVSDTSEVSLKSDFSNYNAKLELVAPGENIYAAAPDNLLVSWSGTSMAAPLVTGSLALALGQTLSVNIKDLTAKVAENAFNVYANGYNQAYKDKLGKKGRLDVQQFLINAVKY